MKFFKIGDRVVLNTDSAKWSVQVEEGTKGTVESIHGDGALDVLFESKKNGGTLRQTVDPEDLDSLEPMKFKVGDKVKYIGIIYQDLKRIVGTVLEAYSDFRDYPYLVDFRDYPYLVDFGIGSLCCAENELASAKKFAIGDRVRIVRHIKGDLPEAVGKTGTIIELLYDVSADGEQYDCILELDNQDLEYDQSENLFDELEKLPTKARKKTLKAISAEVQRARVKFPDNSHLCHALMEEAGEVVKAYLEGEPIENIRNEACQVAAVAVRIIEEGDPDFEVDQ